MKYRQLGRTGLVVSEVGFGAWGIGGDNSGSIAYGPTDDDESVRALRRAFELGITFYDTSPLYGYGHSEELIGRALGEVRSRVVIATKAGMLDARGTQDFSAKHIRASVESSLRRLRTDYVDLLQLHSPPIEPLERDGSVRRSLQELQAAGKIRAYGVSVRSPDDGLTAAGALSFPCIQVNFNLTDQRALRNGLFDLCQRENVGVIVRTPLCFGFLAGNQSAGGFGASDHRSRWSAEQIARWERANALFAGVTENSPGQTPAQAALRFCLTYPAVASAIPGMLSREHVEENAGAGRLGPFAPDELSQLQQVYQEHEFFVGKA